MALVSVIVPNYNHAPYLEQRIESILAQSFQDFELIILDDKSTDNSSQVIERYRQHPRVAQIVYNDANSGSPFLQWQKGIALAKSDYLWIAESDDFADPALLETAMTGIKKHGVDAAFCNSHLYENEITGQMFATGSGESFVMEGNRMLQNWLVDRTGIRIGNTSAAIIKTSLAKSVSNTSGFAQYRKAGDKLFWLHALAGKKVFVIPQQLNYFRMSAHSTSRSALASLSKVVANAEENLYINAQAKKMLPLSGAEIEELETEKKRRINQILNRTGNPVLRFFRKYYYTAKYAKF